MRFFNFRRFNQTQFPLILAWATFLTLLVCALWIKIILVRGLAYTSDLFNDVQSAKSLLQDRSLFFANDLGLLSYSHNFFILIILAPFVWLFGVYTFLVLSVLLVGAAGSLILREAQIADRRNNQMLLSIIPFILLVGPISFWLFDDPLYGWHIEFLYIPLGLLFTLHLLKQSKLAWLWAALLISCKEDGAVVACSLHLATSIANYAARSQSFRAVFRLKPILDFMKIALGWLAIFALGMYVLAIFAPGSGLRLSGAWQLILAPFQNPKMVRATIDMFSDAGSLVGCTFLAISILMGPGYSLLLIMALLPSFIVNYISASLYASEPFSFAAHGLDWPARFALVWSVFGGVALCAAMRPIIRSRIFPKQFAVKACVLTIGIWTIQYFTLYYALDYRFLHRASVIIKRPKDVLRNERLNRVEQSLLRCLATKLPASTAVATQPLLYGYFHNHDLSSAKFNVTAWKAPDIIICERKGRISSNHTCINVLAQKEANSYQRAHLRGIEVGYKQALSQQVATCLARSEELAAKLHHK